ncbi:YqkE family protein [Solibacillus sp. FSL H8-0538]|uniref:YqkE family protein n=1 Tax=Solibacillus sp. FSL H8-0538 TaxID=2921400 RepID=UPI0030F9E982
MGKKKKQGQKQAAMPKNETTELLTLKDQLGGDVLAKLKAAKQSLVAEVQAQEEERQARLVFERKQKEKNMSFEELLNNYGDQGSKF